MRNFLLIFALYERVFSSLFLETVLVGIRLGRPIGSDAQFLAHEKWLI